MAVRWGLAVISRVVKKSPVTPLASQSTITHLQTESLILAINKMVFI